MVEIRYERNDIEFQRGTFRVRGDVVEVFQSNETENAVRIEFFGDEVEKISDIHALTGRVLEQENMWPFSQLPIMQLPSVKWRTL